MRFLFLAGTALALCLVFPYHGHALDDSAALSELASVKAVYDVRTNEEKTLQFIFRVIRDTYDETIAQKVKAHYVASLRGPTVKFLVRKRYGDAAVQQATLDVLKELATRGIRVEACGYALDMYGIEPEDLYEGVTAVGNSLNSLIGYQSKGYALVMMN